MNTETEKRLAAALKMFRDGARNDGQADARYAAEAARIAQEAEQEEADYEAEQAKQFEAEAKQAAPEAKPAQKLYGRVVPRDECREKPDMVPARHQPEPGFTLLVRRGSPDARD